MSFHRRPNMKVHLLAAVVGLVVCANSLAESPCVECRKAALLEVQRCMASAKSDSEKSACNKKAAELTESCNKGACKAMMGK